MVSLKKNRPLLQTGHCVISDYEIGWMESVLSDAALRAGVSLPFKHEIAQAIMMYLEMGCTLQSMPLNFLFSRIQETLQEVGLPLIARHLRKQTPPVMISLDEIAKEDPMPLFFYAKLHERIAKLRHLGLTSYQFSGLRECALTLGARRRDCPSSQRMQREISAFLESSAA